MLNTVSKADASTPAVAPPTASSWSRVAQPIDINDLINIFRRRWKLGAVVAAFVSLAMLVAAFLIPPVFLAEASIKLDPNTHTLLDLDRLTNGGPPDQAVVDSEVEVMQSRDVALAVVQKLGLTADEDFQPKFGPAAKDPKSPAYMEATIQNVLKKLDVKRNGETYIINMGFHSKDPAKAARIANAFADEYILASIKQRVQTAQAQSVWLNERLSKLTEEVQAADGAVARYKSANGIASAAVGGTVTDQQIGTITSQVAQAESEAAAARSNYEAAQSQVSKSGIDSVSAVINAPTVVQLRQKRTELISEQGDINTRYGPRHPESIKIQQQIDGVDRQIHEEAERIVSGLASDARASEARAAALRGQLGGLKGQLSSNTRASVEADNLQREADAKRAEYTTLAATAQQTSQQEHANETLAQIISRAVEPVKADFPNKPIFAALGVILGLVVGMAVIFALESVDAGVRTVEDVESDLGAPFIASAPLLTAKVLGAGRKAMEPWDFVVAKPMSGYAEAMRTARTALTLADLDRRVKVVAVSSALPNEGKSVTAVSLARVMAMSGDRVIIVDCDLRQNALRTLPANKPTAGLVEVLTGHAPLESVIMADSVPGLDILPLTQVAYTPRDLFGSDSMSSLLRILRERYDQVILDGPPLLAVADARTLATQADAVLMVARWSKTPRQAIRAALSRLEQDGSNVAGVVLSMVDTKARGALSADDPAYYYGTYRSYYQE